MKKTVTIENPKTAGPRSSILKDKLTISVRCTFTIPAEQLYRHDETAYSDAHESEALEAARVSSKLEVLKQIINNEMYETDCAPLSVIQGLEIVPVESPLYDECTLTLSLEES